MTACWFLLPRASPAKCRSGMATRLAGPPKFGEKIGRMTRELLRLPRSGGILQTCRRTQPGHQRGGKSCCVISRTRPLQHSAFPAMKMSLMEICRDELGDRRVCVLTPFGSRVHAPWCMAVTAKLRAERGLEVESMWSDDGFVLRLPDSDASLEFEDFMLSPAELKELGAAPAGLHFVVRREIS